MFDTTWPEDMFTYTSDEIIIQGAYTVTTNKVTLDSDLKLEVRINLPFDVNFQKSFGIVVGIDDRGVTTQTVAAVWNPTEARWLLKNYEILQKYENRNLNMIHVLQHQALQFTGSQLDKKNVKELMSTFEVWKWGSIPEVNDGDELIIRMERDFDVEDETKFLFFKAPERDLILHTTKSWRVGYFDATQEVAL